MLLIDPEAIAVVVSALFGGDPDLAAAPIARDLSPTEIDVAGMVFKMSPRRVNGSGERAFNLRFPLPPAITGAELAKHVVRDGPAVRVDFSIFAGAAAPARIALLDAAARLLKHRGDTVAAQGRLGQRRPIGARGSARRSCGRPCGSRRRCRCRG